MDTPPRGRSPRVAALLAAVPTALSGLVLAVLGVVVLLDADPFGWLGVGAGAVVLVLAVLAVALASWGVALFGGLCVLALSTLAGGVAGDDDRYILTGIACLVGVGCAAALAHQLGRVAEATARRERDA
jgi:hypothetical protein